MSETIEQLKTQLAEAQAEFQQFYAKYQEELKFIAGHQRTQRRKFDSALAILKDMDQSDFNVIALTDLLDPYTEHYATESDVAHPF